MNIYSPAWPHGKISKVLENVYFVMGTNKTNFNDAELVHSRNMVIIKDGDYLSLINAVRLDKYGLKELENLGTIKNVVRIGAFHGRDDKFYLDKYNAQMWALDGITDNSIPASYNKLSEAGPKPFKGCQIINFDSSNFPEAMLYINLEKGLLITCDSIKNWVKADKYFSPETAEAYEKQNSFGKAIISKIWIDACGVSKMDFEKLKPIEFDSLITAHGEPIIGNAKEIVLKRIEEAF